MKRFRSDCTKLISALLMSFMSVSLWAASSLDSSDNKQVNSRLKLSSSTSSWVFDHGLSPGNQLTITGKVEDSTARVLVRIDHAKSHHYFSRFNHEQLLHAGPFTFHIDLDNLKTAHKDHFSSQDIRKLYLRTLTGKLKIDNVNIAAKPKAPDAIKGWDFGPTLEKSTAWGFYAVNPLATWQSIGGNADNRPQQAILQGPIRERKRSYQDELINDGLEGLHHVILPLDNGLWRVKLWTQDVGEWEYLPHPLQRKITLNEQVVLDESLTPNEWRKRYYYQTLNLSEHDKKAYQQGNGDPIHQAFWQQIGQKRGSPIEAIVEVSNGQLKIELTSPTPAGRFLSAVIATPWNHQAEQQLIDFEQRRAQAFKQRWPIIIQPALSLDKLADIITWGTDTPLIAAGELVTLQVTIPSTMGKLKDVALPLDNVFWFKQTSVLSRVGGQENALTLRSLLASFDPFAQAPSKDEVWIIVGEVLQNAKTKTLSHATLSFEHGEMSTAFIPLDMTLNTAQQPVGLYLDYAPHLSWFSSSEAEQQAKQDYIFFKQLGLTGVAPALPTPNESVDRIQAFKRAVQQPLLAGLQPPFPAYTPLKRMLNQTPSDLLNTLSKLSSLEAILLWSLADEPGLFTDLDDKLMGLNETLTTQRPTLQRYGQLNQQQHDQLAGKFSQVLVNHGYGLSASRFTELQAQGIDYYLYNLNNLRAAGGHYLWRSKAKGFWQWHARMPTAHPYDPTDGREDDVQFILPTELNEKHRVIRRDLLSLRSGINDLRWLTWLSQNAKKHIDFAILEQKIAQSISLNYEKNSFINKDLNKNINEIKRLAQRLQRPQ